RVPLAYSQRLLELRQDLEQVTDQAEVRDFEDRRLRVLVDRHDGAGVLDAGEVLDGAGDAGRHVQLGGDDLAGLANLQFVGHVAGIDGRARGADRGAELVGQRVDQLEVVGRPQGAAAG